MTESHEKLYDILLDIRKEMGSHTAKLEGIEKKQTELTKYQEYANSKTAKNIADIEANKSDIALIKQSLEDYPSVKEKLSDVLTTKKAIVMLCGAVVVVGASILGITRYAFESYQEKKIKQILKDNLGLLLQDSGYDKIEIREEFNN